MIESVLDSVKKILGIAQDYTVFDHDIITHINTSLMILSQLGIGPTNGVSITGSTETWDDLFGPDQMLNSIQTYVYLRVRLLFDPPGTSFLLKAHEEQLRELEWRLSSYRESISWTPATGPSTIVIDGGSP